jgi:hypothetical protein
MAAPPGWQMPQLAVKKKEDLSISVVVVLLLRANWLESEEGGHHLPNMPSDKSHGLVGL